MIADQRPLKSISFLGYSLVLCKDDVSTLGETYCGITIQEKGASISFFKPTNQRVGVFMEAMKQIVAKDAMTFASISDERFDEVMDQIDENIKNGDSLPNINPVLCALQTTSNTEQDMFG